MVIWSGELLNSKTLPNFLAIVSVKAYFQTSLRLVMCSEATLLNEVSSWGNFAVSWNQAACSLIITETGNETIHENDGES